MGRTVIITGTNRGIGNAILRRFAREEDVFILAHARKASEKFDDELKAIKNRADTTVRIEPFYCDLADKEEIKTAFTNLLKQHKKVDVLVNNAGVVMPSKSFLMMDENTLRTSFEINFFAQVQITQMVCRAMIRNKGGAIINMASVAAFSGVEGQFEYTASKAAIVGMTRRLSNELAPYHIRVNAVAPGMINTDMIMQMDDQMRTDLLTRVIAHRLGEPDEIASTVYFLASNEASFINGQSLLVNGGGIAFDLL